jgi:hypothetical protein
MTIDERDLLSRRQFLREYGISDSGEQRGRTGGPWPPHLRIGHKIYYRRRSVEQWLTEQERATRQPPVADLRALFPTLDEDTRRVANELVNRAPTLSREQLDSILAAIAGGDAR